MNPGKFSREEIEQRLTALLLGELPAEEAALLRWAISQDAELAKLHDRLKQAIDFTREAVTTPAGPATTPTASLKLSDERRQKLLAHFKLAPPRAVTPEEMGLKRFKISRVIEILAVVAVLAVLAAMLLPALASAKRKARSVTAQSEMKMARLKAEMENESAASAPAAPMTPPAVVTASPQPAPSTEIVLPKGGEASTGAYGGVISANVVGYANPSDISKSLRYLDTTNSFTEAPSQSLAFSENGDVNGLTTLGAKDSGTTFQNKLSVTTLQFGANAYISPQGQFSATDEVAFDDRKLGTSGNGTIAGTSGVAAPQNLGENQLAINKTRDVGTDRTPLIGDLPAAGRLFQSGSVGSLPGSVPPPPAESPALAPTVAPPASGQHSAGEFVGDLQKNEPTIVYNSINGTKNSTDSWQNGLSDSTVSGGLALNGQNSWRANGGSSPSLAIPLDSFQTTNAVALKRDGGGSGGGGSGGSVGRAIVSDSGTLEQLPVLSASKKEAGTDVQDGKLLYEAGKFQEAETQLNKALKADPNNQAAFYYLNLAKQADHSKQPSNTQDKMMQVQKEWTSSNEDRPLPKVSQPAPIPQPEMLTRENAFSTFSLNVSDVSFKLTAASLQNGQLPDAASIRSEEFINAFDYRDPEAKAGSPVAFASERARDPFSHNRDLLRFSIKTAAQGRQADRPLNIVLLLDDSGSMERADRVQIIREALRVLASQLHPQDIVSVITFARTPRLWADGISGDKAGETLDKVGGITPDGGTNLEEAMNLAYQTALRHYLANGANRVVLLTDGAANLGNVNPDALKQKVESFRKQGVALDCFGIGWEGYNDDLLEELSSNGDGRYGFLNTPEEAATGFAAQLAGALKVAAQDVKVQVEFNPQRVTSWRQIGYAKHQLTKQQFRDNSVAAGEIAAQEAGNALYTIEVNPNGEGSIATVRVRYKIPGTTDFREQSWDVPYTGSATALEKSSAAMRLAATTGEFSEWLAASPFAQEVTPDELLNELNGVPQIYGADARPKKLEWMIRQAKSISGK